MPEWHRGMEPKTPKERFNRVHSSIRNVIERSFGVLKMKWQILYKMASYPMFKQKMIVVATMVLHNFIREHGGEDLDFVILFIISHVWTIICIRNMNFVNYPSSALKFT